MCCENAEKTVILMHLKAEELLGLLHGETPAEQLTEQLDHLDACAECAGAFEVMVALRAHREEAQQSLELAKELESAGPIPFPVPTATPAWSGRFLALAATVALAALTGLMVWGTPIRSLDGLLAGLAVDEFVQAPLIVPAEIRPASGDETPLQEAVGLLESNDFTGALAVLEAQPAAFEDELTGLYLGIAQYFAGRHEEVLETLASLTKSADTSISRPARWYEANALLRLGRAQEALVVFDELSTSSPDLDQALYLIEAQEMAGAVRVLLDS